MPNPKGLATNNGIGIPGEMPLKRLTVIYGWESSKEIKIGREYIIKHSTMH